MHKTPNILTLLAATGLAGLSSYGQAASVEAFDYTTGSVLTDKGSASDAGFSGPWYSSDNMDIVSGSLDGSAYPVLPASGNRVFWNTDRGFRDLDKVYSGETDDVLYISYLWRESQYILMVYSAFELFNGGTNDKVNRVFAMGALQNDSAGLDGIPYYERISARMNNVQDTVDYLGDRDQSLAVEFYVLKIDLRASDADSISIWRNPTGPDIGEPTVIISDLPEFPLIFDRIALSTWDNPDGLGYKSDFDEIRTGSTLADVMVVETGGNTWYGYDVDESGWANTGSWLSSLNVTLDPWIWSDAMDKFVYIQDDSGWLYIPRN